jgi:hypothetical protein
MLKRFSLMVMGLIFLVALVGCGGGGGGNTGTPSKIVITPGTAQVLYDGGKRQFTGVCTDSSGNIINASLSWSVNPATMGTIDQNGLFTAGITKGQCTITCSYSGLNAQATVNIIALVDAGQQIVMDTQSVWGNLQAPTSGLNDMMMDINKLIPDLEYVSAPFNTYNSYINPWFLSRLFKFTPNTYTVMQVYNDTPQNSSYQMGTWTVVDNKWTVTVIRSLSGVRDNVTFTITNSDDTSLRYSGTYTYPTAYLNDPNVSPMDSSINLTFKNQDLRETATVVGNIHYDNTAKTGTFTGTMNFKFKDGEQLSYTGDWKIDHDTATEDYLKGTITTANLTIDGEIKVQYADNPNMPVEYYHLFPKSLILNGSLRNNSSTPVILNGSLTCVILNAGTINPNISESSTNYLDGSVTFAGSVKNGQNQIEVSIGFEQTAYQKYGCTIKYNLTNAGVKRNFNLSVSNHNPGDYNNFDIIVNSDWGSATININLELSSDHSITGVSGSVVTGGKKIADISLSGGIIWVYYINGDNEGFQTL